MKRALTRTLTRTAVAIACLAIALAATCLNPAPAHAIEVRFDNDHTAVLNDDGSITGTCSTVVTFVPLSMDDVDHFDVYMPDGQILRGQCIDHGFAVPANATYTFTATPVGNGAYSVVVESGFAEWVVHTDGSIERGAPDPSQRVGRIIWEPRFVLKGSISLTKESSVPEITDGNAYYSLAGAVYGVFTNREDAAAGDASKAIATYTTDETGTWASGNDFEVGEYYVGEITPPRGYERNAGYSVVMVRQDQETEVQDADTPVTVPIDVQTRKHDADTGAAEAQGDASLAGAEVTFRYYAGRYDTANLPETPTRTWVMKTDGNGIASLAAGKAMQAAGDDFFYDGTGNVVIPFGTVTATETKAPDGYLLNSAWKATVPVNENTSSDISMDLDEPIGKGALTLTKLSRHLKTTGPAGDGSLAGARFDIVNDSANPVVVCGREYQKGDVVLSIASDDAGVAATEDRVLPVGRYIVREVRTTERGYLLDEVSREWSRTFSIDTDGQRFVIEPDDDGISNDEIRGNVELQKVDEETGAAEPQGDSTLAGAAFAIVNKSNAPVASPQTGGQVDPGDVVCTIVTDENGHASTTAASVNGWAIPEDFNGKALTYGTYEIREVSPPLRGYLADEDWIGEFTVREDGQLVEIDASDPIGRGRVVVGKVSRDTGTYTEQGAASLEGWTFEIVNRSENPVIVDGAKCAPGDVVCAITTERVGNSFIADSGERRLPYGTYEVREVESTQPGENGYLFDSQSEAWSRLFEIAEDGETVDLTSEADACPNQVVRGDLGLVKAKDPGMGRLAGIPFKVTSTTTGEWHVIVTDRNGEASTAAEFNPHTARTNANDEALDANGVVDESKLDEKAGIWFDGCAEIATEPDDGLGALPFDTYDVEELRVQANEGLDLVSFEVTVFRDSATVDVGTVVDAEAPVPDMRTSLESAEGGKVVAAKAEAELVDTVSFSGLDPSIEYRIVGELHLVEDGEAGALLATAYRSFTPDLPHGEMEVPFTVDTSALEGRSLVCFEKLLDSDERLIASHEDPADEGQTVSIPAIRTTLVDTSTDGHVATVTEAGCLELTDTVTYAGLAPHRAYTVTGTLHDKATGAAVLDSRGIPVTATRSFTPDKPEGSVDVTFAFKLGDVEADDIVAFESLSFHGVEYAVHADLEDEQQTVTVPRPPEEERIVYQPKIKTELLDVESGTHFAKEAAYCNLVDTVAYEGLEPGVPYKVVGCLYDRETGKPLASPEGDGTSTAQDGFAVEREFTPDESSGSISVPFAFKADLSGKTVVAFERVLDAEGHLMAAHEDIDDEGQSATFPTPPVEKEQPKEPQDEPKKPEGGKATSDTLAKTGDTLRGMAFALIPAGAIGLALAALSVRRLERETASKAKHGKRQ